jgi:hypothetical protein
VKNPVSGAEFSGIRPEGRESRGVSLLDDFQYPKFWERKVRRQQETADGALPPKGRSSRT